MLLPSIASAQLSYVPFSSIKERSHDNDSAAPAVAGIVPVKYRTIRGPADTENDSRKNLTDEQAGNFVLRLKMLTSGNPKLPAMSKPQMFRLFLGLDAIDHVYVEPLSASRWDDILRAMGDTGAKEFGKKSKDWDVVIDHMLQAGFKQLKDPHSEYLDPAQTKAFHEYSNGTFSGIGITLSSHTQGIRVRIAYPGSGAEAAGIKAGDVITWVDGESVAGLAIEDIIKKLKGPADTVVSVKVLREGILSEPISITRTKVVIPKAFSKMAAPGIGYVYFPHFESSVDTLVIDSISRLKSEGARAVILDVRSNPGGDVRMVSSISSEFLKDGDEIVSFQHQGQVDFKNVTDGDGKFAGTPVVVLVDAKSASASEILSGTLQDKLGRPYTIIGSRSFGKGTQQQILPQPNGRLLKLTQNRWYTPKGRSIDAQKDPDGREIPGTGGILPNIAVDVSEEQTDKIMNDITLELFERSVPEPRTPDPVLEKAIEVLSNIR